MKKAIVVAAGLLFAVSFKASAQGTVTFANSNTSLVTAEVGGPAVPTGLNSGYGGLLVGLFWGVQGSTEDQLVQIGATASINPIAGRYSGGTRTTGAGTAAGATATFQVRAWSADLGATWAEAQASGGTGWIGASTLFDSATGGAGEPPSTPINLNASVPGFAVTLVPEPSVIALAVLGAGALFFRRKKA